MTYLLLGIAAALVAIGGPDPAPADVAGETIRVVSATHRVDFPDEVVFQLEAEAASPISEVVLYYSLARQPVNVYGYPDFTPSTRVSANFRVQTGGASYIPTGVDIEYHYRITDSEGNSFETPAYHVEYLDPRFTWQRLRQGELVVLWHGIPESRVKQVAAEVEGRIPEITGVLGLGSVPPMKAVLISGRLEASRSFPVVSRAASEGHIYGGFAFSRFDLFVLAGLSADGMVHEMTHLLMGEAAGSPLAKVPAWLDEGLSMYFETGSHRREATVARAVRDGTLLKLRSMGAVPGRPADVAIFYAQSWSIAKHMIDVHGPERVGSLVRGLDEGLPIDAALQSAYGFGLEELEREWKAGLVGETTLAPRPDPGTVGTSVLIAAAVVIALIGSAAGLVSRRFRRSSPEGADEPEGL